MPTLEPTYPHFRVDALIEPSLHKNLPSAVQALIPPLLLEQGLLPLASTFETKQSDNITATHIFLDIIVSIKNLIKYITYMNLKQ